MKGTFEDKDENDSAAEMGKAVGGGGGWLAKKKKEVVALRRLQLTRGDHLS